MEYKSVQVYLGQLKFVFAAFLFFHISSCPGNVLRSRVDGCQLGKTRTAAWQYYMDPSFQLNSLRFRTLPLQKLHRSQLNSLCTAGAIQGSRI